MSIKLNSKILIAGLGCTAAVATAWGTPLQDACDKFGISESREGVASFLANISVESNGLTKLVENMNYTAARLAAVWPSRYAIDPHTALKLPNPLAISIAGNPKLIANTTYANRLGNGDVNSGDGWKFRGEGPMQLTGRANIEAFFEAAGLPLDTDPQTLQQPENGAASAAFFFTKLSKAFKFAAAGDFDHSVKEVNGQLPCSANQGDLRRTRYEAALAEIPVDHPTTETTAPAAPVTPPVAPVVPVAPAPAAAKAAAKKDAAPAKADPESKETPDQTKP